MIRTLAAIVVAVSLAQTPQPSEQRVLFIGNSLTYANDLPKMVESLARAKDVRVTTEMVAFPDYSLEDHWQRGDAVRAIRQGKWSLVVLQQGPSAMPESQVSLREYVKRFDVEIRKVGAKTGLYMVWPSRSRMQDFDGVSASYSAAAKDVNGVLFPVGDAWRAAWKRDASLALYSADGLHPTREGTYLAALVIVTKAFGISPLGLPALGISPTTARLLQEVVSSFPPPPNARYVRGFGGTSPFVSASAERSLRSRLRRDKPVRFRLRRTLATSAASAGQARSFPPPPNAHYVRGFGGTSPFVPVRSRSFPSFPSFP